MPQVVDRKMRHACSFQRSLPSGLHTADWLGRFAWAWKDKRRIMVRFFFPLAQYTVRQIRKRKRLGGARRFHVAAPADQFMLPIHLVPTQTESFAIGPPSRLHEQDNANAKMGRCLTQDAVLLVQREHLLVRTVPQCFTARAGFSGMYCLRTARSSVHVRHSSSRLTVAPLMVRPL